MNATRCLLAAVVLGVVTSVFANEPRYTEFVRRLSCPESFAVWQSRLRAVETDAAKFVSVLTPEQADAKIDSMERDVIFVTLVWPALLREVVNGARLYDDCAGLHWQLIDKPSRRAEEAWVSCVRHGYGRMGTPEVFEVLRGCYEGLLRRAPR